MVLRYSDRDDSVEVCPLVFRDSEILEGINSEIRREFVFFVVSDMLVLEYTSLVRVWLLHKLSCPRYRSHSLLETSEVFEAVLLWIVGLSAWCDRWDIYHCPLIRLWIVLCFFEESSDQIVVVPSSLDHYDCRDIDIVLTSIERVFVPVPYCVSLRLGHSVLVVLMRIIDYKDTTSTTCHGSSYTDCKESSLLCSLPLFRTVFSESDLGIREDEVVLWSIEEGTSRARGSLHQICCVSGYDQLPVWVTS